MLNQRQLQKQTQKLSPQQIKLMKMLQVPTLALESQIKQELEENPALELVGEDFMANQLSLNDSDSSSNDTQEERDREEFDEVDVSGYIDNDDDMPSYQFHDASYGNADEPRTIPRAFEKTFHEYLMEQLGMHTLTEREYLIANQLVGTIDEDGYLRRSLESIANDLYFETNMPFTLLELEDKLLIIQQFDPPGVGARTLQECLLIQLKRKNPDKDLHVKLALTILQNHFEEFTRKHYDKLCRLLQITDEDLKGVIGEIIKLNPKPGNAYSPGGNSISPENYIVPDFLVSADDDQLILTLNARNAPELRVSEAYAGMLRDYKKNKKKDRYAKEAVLFIKQKIDSAKWFIDAIKQRQQTMLKTMEAILTYQHEYFLTGDSSKLRPMILKDVADITGLDISTVSRVSNSKYVQTDFGTFLLKSFFSESLSTASGEEVSTKEVKNILTEMIENENKKKPLSDDKLTEELKNRGYEIARRTVAKYREQLDIPVARLRKKL